MILNLPINPSEVGYEIWVVGGATLSTLYTLYTLHTLYANTLYTLSILYTLFTSYTFYTKEKGKLLQPKGKREKVVPGIRVRIPLGNQTARTHALTNDTKRKDFLVGLNPQPPIHSSVIIR